MNESLHLLQNMAEFARLQSRSSADKPCRLAVVDPDYYPWTDYPSATPAARVTFEGEDGLSGKAYPILGGMIPHPGTRVLLIPVGNTYVIAAAVSPATPQGFWANAAGTESGVELGGGSRYDTSEGLVIAGDASIAGDLSVGGGGIGRGVQRVQNYDTNSATYGTSLTAVNTMSNFVMAAGRAYKASFGPGVQHTAAGYVDVRLLRTTGTAVTLWEHYRHPITAAGVVMAVQSHGYFRNIGSLDITLDLQWQMATNTGTGVHIGAPSRHRYYMVEDVGRAVDFPMAYGLAS